MSFKVSTAMLTKWGLSALKFLGLSKAGGVVFHTKVSQLKNRNAQRVANLEGVENSRVSLLMVYSIDSVTEENHRVLIYQGENAKEQVIGIVLITGWVVNLVLVRTVHMHQIKLWLLNFLCEFHTERGVEGREFPLSMGWTPKDLEQLIPYMLAVYLLLDVAKIKENNTLLILPPIGKSYIKTYSFHSENCKILQTPILY